MNLDHEFRKKILDIHIGLDGLKLCYECNRCTEVCPDKTFDPRKIITSALFGYRDEIIKNATIPSDCEEKCKECEEVCPQEIQITRILSYIRDLFS
ncbi:MAG: 4Fe-4S dicluster domain-containing protein [archaeon]|nr:4Fe-4S dicluster domain-containing protein [archaeon]